MDNENREINIVYLIIIKIWKFNPNAKYVEINHDYDQLIMRNENITNYMNIWNIISWNFVCNNKLCIFLMTMKYGCSKT
jgi:hypothetical protein